MRSIVVEENQYERSVVVEFAKPNIPVKNGVVHLIKNVLCHIDEKVVSAIRVSWSFRSTISYKSNEDRLMKLKREENFFPDAFTGPILAWQSHFLDYS